MVTKSLTKLIDQAIFPAAVRTTGKMIGLFLTSYDLNVKFEVVPASFLRILPTVHFPDQTSYILAENYSNLAMFIASSMGAIFVTLRAHFFHASHISPRLHAKLASLNLEMLVSTSYHLYYQAAIWITFLWLSTAFLITSSIAGVTYVPISIFAFIIAANFSWVFALDVEKEVEIQKGI